MRSELTEPPKVDFLFWDREDRDIQFNNVQRLVAHGKRMLAMTAYCTEILSRGEDHVLRLQVIVLVVSTLLIFDCRKRCFVVNLGKKIHGT